MNFCPKCKEPLNIDERSSGKCFSCGATFKPVVFDNSANRDSYQPPKQIIKDNENIVAKWLKIVSGIIVVFGLIGSVVLADQGRSFSWETFLFSFFTCVVSSLFLDAMAEIITLLQDIKDKIK